MKLSISNIAWPQESERRFLRHIAERGCSGIEIAASKIWSEPVNTKADERNYYKRLVAGYGLDISALQALLYTRKDLGLFKGKEIEVQTINYLKKLCRLASDLGAHILVFGSPANRSLKGFFCDDIYEYAACFFYQIAREAEKCGVIMCIEPLSREHTDFINTGLEGMRLVEMVGSRGFGLHLDSAALYDEGSSVAETFKKTIHMLQHFHISEPNLAEINSSGKVDHKAAGAVLREIGYKDYVSIEMRTQPNFRKAIETCLLKARSLYLGIQDSSQ